MDPSANQGLQSSVVEKPKFVVYALYKFFAFPEYQQLQQPLLTKLNQLSIVGTILLAEEGINGTIAGAAEDMDDLLQWLDQKLGLGNVQYKISYSDTAPFKRTKVKLKKEIVTMGVGAIDPRKSAGRYVKPEQWNELISQPEVLLVDTRNQYEIKVGKFENAVNPHTTNFREFPEYVEKNLDPTKHKKIAMYCTGGIRCEKSTAYLKQKGFEEVFHLEGGILNYLEKIPQKESKWQGECFVFDDRVTVDHNLDNGSYEQCHACRMPISDEDKQSNQYQIGVSCPNCYNEKSNDDRARYAEREKQVQLAKKRGEAHIAKTLSKK